MPVKVYPGKILGNRAQIGIVGKARLLVQQGFFILGVFFEIHKKPFDIGDYYALIAELYYFLRQYCKKSGL